MNKYSYKFWKYLKEKRMHSGSYSGTRRGMRYLVSHDSQIWSRVWRNCRFLEHSIVWRSATPANRTAAAFILNRVSHPGNHFLYKISELPIHIPICPHEELSRSIMHELRLVQRLIPVFRSHLHDTCMECRCDTPTLKTQHAFFYKRRVKSASDLNGPSSQNRLIA